MIRIFRGNEPPGLAARRTTQLASLGSVAPERTSSRRSAYQSVKPDLVAMQRHKCCYCERRTIPDHNDVEHYRPFAKYWWLAWTWENLLFACAACNQKGGKLDQFPLEAGSVPLQFGELPPGNEVALLVDPSNDNPREHIHYVHSNNRWFPIGKTERGRETIRVLGLSRDTYRDEVDYHVKKIVVPVVEDIRNARATKNSTEFQTYWCKRCSELLDPERPFLGLSEDVLRHEFPTYPNPP